MTQIEEIAADTYRISTPVPPEAIPGGFSFNQFLIVDEAPLLFHTGPRALFDGVRAAVAKVMPLERLRFVAYSHHESDESGSMNQWLAIAPEAVPVCSVLGAMVSMTDLADRAPRPLAHGQRLELGKHVLRWLDAPHLPHGMDTGYLFDETHKTLFCGDLFAQPGDSLPAVTEGDIFGPSEAFRQAFPYAPISNAAELCNRLAQTEPALLACMHGSSYRGDGARLLQELGRAVST